MKGDNSLKVSVVIPAYNEARTVGGVVASACAHPRVGEILVVDDGSHDRTAQAAQAAGARVIRHERNLGKAAALETGAAAALHDIFFFIDADIAGLSHEHFDEALAAVTARGHGMFVLVVDRKRWPSERFSRHLPLLGGTRALHRRVWESVPPEYKKNFQIELALNYFAKRSGHSVGHAVVPGLTHVMKETKRGLLKGLYQRAFMIRDIVVVMCKLHFAHRVWNFCVSRIGGIF